VKERGRTFPGGRHSRATTGSRASKRRKCAGCGGPGKKPCTLCGGSGYLITYGVGGYKNAVDCDKCLGVGRIVCDVCDGEGVPRSGGTLPHMTVA
jgi:DnaJ-class molecular chaperone